MKITRCRVNHLKNPLGYRFDRIVLSCVAENCAGKRKEAARYTIYMDEACTDLVYDSGKGADISLIAHPVKIALLPRRRYFWKAEVWTEAGEYGESSVNYFETGKMNEAWAASWITPPTVSDRHPIFTRAFKAEKTVVSARLYITGLGLYEAALNGAPVTDEKLTPGSTDYKRWIQVATYDVTDLIREENRISVTLGNGWYKGRFGYTTKPGDPGYYGDRFLLLAELRLNYADGTTEVIGTDGSWDVTESAITASNLYDGEAFDATLTPGAPVKAAVYGRPASLKKELPLSDRLSLPVKGHAPIAPVALLTTPKGEKVFDLGQNFAGGFALKVREPAGTKISLEFGEVLQEGNFYRDNLRSALARYDYVCDGSETIVSPRFTYYGYRYVKVTGIEDLSIDDFAGIPYWSDVEETGHMKAGNEDVNRLISCIKWGQKSNFIDVPTDCPQRDEKMGWTADTQVFLPTASYFTDAAAFYRKYLFDMHAEQADLDGMVPDTVPSAGHEGKGTAVWGDAAVIMPWNLYVFTGDKGFLEENLDGMMAWVDWVKRLDEGEEEPHAWGRHFQFGDWLALDSPSGQADGVKGGTDDAYVAYCYYWHSLDLVRRSAEILGKSEIAREYGARADAVYSYIEDEFFTKTGRLAVDTQTGCVLALSFGLAQEPDRVVCRLTDLLALRGDRFATGFVGTPLLLPALSAAGEDALAYRLLFNRDYPGWFYEIDLGATTVWERWNSLGPDGKVSSTGMNSFNHYAYGSVGQWLFETAAGISLDPAAPGFRKAILRPVPNAAMKSFSATLETPAGRYETAWEVVDETHVHLTVTVPFDAEAELTLPLAREKGPLSLGPGTHEYSYETEKPLMKHFSADTVLSVLLGDSEAAAVIDRELPQAGQFPEDLLKLPLKEAASAFMEGSDALMAGLKRADERLRLL